MRVVGGVKYFVDHANDEWCRYRLVTTGRDDMKLVGASEKGGNVEWRIAG